MTASDATTWYLYLVRTGDDHLYTGIAIDVERRLAEHRDGQGRGARFLRGRGPLELVYRQAVGDRALALRAEHRVKRLARPNKEILVRANPGLEELLRLLRLDRPGSGSHEADPS